MWVDGGKGHFRDTFIVGDRGVQRLKLIFSKRYDVLEQGFIACKGVYSYTTIHGL